MNCLQDLSAARRLVKGDWRSIDDLKLNFDQNLIKKGHKLKDEELGENLLNCLISRVAAKDCL